MSHNINTPLLTVVVPVYNSVLYLEECLDSLLDQDFFEEELEVLMVNDGSTDGSELILQKYAEKHSNFRQVNRQNGGLSAARNTGLSEATGKFITFCDSDDIVPKGAYKKTVDRLLRSGSDFAVGPIYRFSKANPSLRPFNRVQDLFETEKVGLTITEHPEYIRETTPHNKIYSREFFLSTGVTFPEGRIYEDVATTPKFYLLARQFDVVDYAVYYWRVTPNGITQTINPVKATDRLWGIKQILNYFDGQKTPSRITDQYDFGVLDYNLRWVFLDLWKFDKQAQQEIIEQCSEILKRIDNRIITKVQSPISDWAIQIKNGNKSEAVRILSAPHNVVDRPPHQHRVRVALDTLRRYLSAVNRKARHATKVLLRRVNKSFIYLVFRPIVYQLPVDTNMSVFSNYWGKEFLPYGPATICLRLEELAPLHKKIVFAHKNRYSYIVQSIHKNVGTHSNIKIIRNNTLAYYYYLWRAKYLFNDVNFSVGFRDTSYTEKRSGQIEVQTTHGIPLKTLGLDSKDYENEFDRNIFLAKSKRYDYLASSSPLVAEIFTKSHRISPKILEVGLPQNDYIFKTHSSGHIVALKSKYGLDPNKKTIVYAPTFRYDNGYAFRYLLDFSKLYERFKDTHQVIIKVHPFNHTHLEMIDFRKYTQYGGDTDSSQPFIRLLGEVRSGNGSSILKTSQTAESTMREIIPGDINELMLVADALITDYSSVIFNYTHLSKPLVLFTPDIDYYNSTRGTYFNIDDISPGAVTKNTEQVIESIALSANSPGWNQKYGQKIAVFKKRFLVWETGDASRAIIDQIGILKDVS